jgi:hypothetical protein
MGCLLYPKDIQATMQSLNLETASVPVEKLKNNAESS